MSQTFEVKHEWYNNQYKGVRELVEMQQLHTSACFQLGRIM